MRPTPLARGIACAVALALFVARPAHAQRDTLETGPGTFGLPVIASVQVGDIMPIHGIVHVAWTRDAALRHAWMDFGDWQIEAVADSALSYDIAVKGDGLATIALADGSGRLIFAEREPGGWVRDTVLTVPGATLRVSTAPGGEPAFVWIQFFSVSANSARLRHARRTGGAWTITEIDSGLAIHTPSFAIAAGPRPLIAAVRFPGGGLLGNAALYEGAGPNGPFTSQVADTTCIGPVGLAWDPARGRPFIAFGARRPGDFDLYRDYKVAWRDPAAIWHEQEVGTPESGTISAVSIALDPVGAVGALWARQGQLPAAQDETAACGSSTVPHFSRQRAGVPSAPFDPAVPLLPAPGVDAIFGNRAVASHQYGMFDLVWREPRTTCAPFAIVYQELQTGTTGIPRPPIPADARLELSPTPRRAGDAVRVRWSQPRAADVWLMAHDVAGRVVMSFAAGRLPAGEHEHAWTPDRLAPGLYWLSLRLDGERVAGRTLVSR